MSVDFSHGGLSVSGGNYAEFLRRIDLIIGSQGLERDPLVLLHDDEISSALCLQLANRLKEVSPLFSEAQFFVPLRPGVVCDPDWPVERDQYYAKKLAEGMIEAANRREPFVCS